MLGGQVTDRTITPREILADPNHVQYRRAGVMSSANSYTGGATYPYEILAGTFIAELTSGGDLVPCKRSAANGAGAASTSLIVDDATYFKSGETITIKGTRDIVKTTHNASASSTGLALYLHMDELGENDFGHLESVTANNADSSFTTINGAVVKVEDDDAAATGGVAVYFDEDAAEGSKLLAAVPTGKDAFIFDTAGRAIRIKYAATPSSAGVLLYFDDDGAANTRLLYVSPTTANGVFLTDDVVGIQTKITRSSTNAVSAIDYTTETLTITAASWVDGDEVYCDSLAGSETAIGILNEFVDLYDPVTQAATRRKVTAVVVHGEVLDSMLLGDKTAILAADRAVGGADNLRMIRVIS